MNYQEAIYLFLILIIIVFIIDYFFINKRKLTIIENKGHTKNGKTQKIKNIGEIDYLVGKFKLNYKKLNLKQVIFWVSLINSFIISFTSSIIMLLPLKIIWQMVIAFAILFSLIYSIYEIYGRHLKKQTKDLK